MKKYFVLLSSFILPITKAAEHASSVITRAKPLESSLTGMALSLLTLSLIIGGLYWFTRRFLIHRVRGGGRMHNMQIISVTMLGPKEKIVVIDTREGEILVLGVTSQHISLLDKRPLGQTKT